MSASGTLLLGFTDEPIPASRVVNALTSKIGGYAVVYGGESVSLLCRSCKSQRCRLVSQIYCPVDELFHRTIYVFCCLSPSCHRTCQGWRILRLQSSIATVQTAKTERVTQRIDWNTDDADDWGDAAADDWGNAAARPFKPDLSTSNSSTNKPSEALPRPAANSIDIDCLVSSIDGLTVADREDTPYDSYYVSVVVDCGSAAGHEGLSRQGRQLMEECERQADKIELWKGGKGASSAAEKYEKSDVAHGDRTFYKFTKTVSKNSTQIIRYDYGGSPLPMRSLERENIPQCENCGAVRTYELQLMPALVQSLTVGGQTSTLDVGTVIIYSCSSSCWTGKPLLEYAVVQHDPDEQTVLNKIQLS